MTTNTIKHDQLKVLVSANGVKEATVIGSTGGFLLQVTTHKLGDVLLHKKTGELRVFTKSDAVFSYLKKQLGIGQARVQLERWEPDQQSVIG
jgi:hypothetical protein